MKNHGRGILVALVTAMAITSVGLCTPAQASAPVPTAKVTKVQTDPAAKQQKPGRLGEASSAFSLDNQWWGVNVRFNHAETIKLAGAGATCSLFLGSLPAWIGLAFKWSCGWLAIVAGGSLMRGGCLAVFVPYVGALPKIWNVVRC